MGSSEKFCLKWNDFQQNVSTTFSQLRQQSGLFDVTLVSSDQQQVSAHRLVLSACSDFFKTIFHSNAHSHPLLYLDGVNSGEINLMLDYIYQGEVQIQQEFLDRFLEVAQKFQLDGLLPKEEDGGSFKDDRSSDAMKNESQISNDIQSNVTVQTPYIHSSKNVKERSLKLTTQTFDANNTEVDGKFEELVVRENNTFRCTVCEKTMGHKYNMKKHLETHLTGLSYDCHHCGKTFRSSNSLHVHSYEHKKKQ